MPESIGAPGGKPGTAMMREAGSPGPLKNRLMSIASSCRCADSPAVTGSVVARSLQSTRAQTVLMSAFGFLALVLAASGIYGVMAQLTAMRTHEIGVRMSLGARPGVILRQALASGLGQTAIGLAIGLTTGVFLMRFAETLLFGITPWDPWTLSAVSALLIAAALAACFIPARRAMRVAPVEALRNG